METVSNFVQSLLQTANPYVQGPASSNFRFLDEAFGTENNRRQKRDNLEAFLCQSATFTRSRIPCESHPLNSPRDRRLSAKLHVMYGVPIDICRRGTYRSSYGFAASMVYDLRNYTTASFWGPYLPDRRATVDWEKMEAAFIVLGHNLGTFSNTTRGMFSVPWQYPWLGVTPNSFTSINLSSGPERSLHPEDPYNVTGTWMRVRPPDKLWKNHEVTLSLQVVCFLGNQKSTRVIQG